MIDMNGIDFAQGPTGGIYLMGHDTTREQVGRGGGGMLGSTRLKGWDGGRFVPGDVKTSAEALRLTGLDWTVEKHPVLRTRSVLGVGEDGTPTVMGWEPLTSDEPPATGKGQQANTLPTGGYSIEREWVCNVRQDNGQTLGVVGPGWTNEQNRDAFTFVDDLVDSGDAKFLGGGEKGGGRKVWLAAQLDRGVALGGDENEMSIPICFFSNGWDGYTPLTVTVAPYRLACLNGQTIPLEGYVRTWKARHTSGLKANERLQEARKTLELSIGYFDAWAQEMERLMQQPLTTQQVTPILKHLFPDAKKGDDGEARKRAQNNVEAKRDAVLTIFKHQPDLQNLAKSKYRLLNAVTEYADWHVKLPSSDVQVLRSAEAHPLKDAAYKVLVGTR
jgi:phage/plasmid-like protein (TIGR03299 family)